LALTTIAPPASAATAELGAGWPQFGYSGHLTFSNDREQVLGISNVAQLQQRWTADYGRGGIAPLSPATVVGRRVYVGLPNGDGGLYAIDARDGKVLWTGPSEDGSVMSGGAVWNGRVYASSLDGNLYAWPVDCGGVCAPDWSTPIGSLGTNGPPTVAGGTVYVGGYDGRLYAFDAATGGQLWWGQVNDQVQDPLNFGTAVTASVVLVSGSYGVYAFPRTCSAPCLPRWVFRTRYSPMTAPAVVGHTAYVTSGPGVLHAIDLDTHSELWRATVADGSHGIAVGGGKVFVAPETGFLEAFDAHGCGAATCGPVWTSMHLDVTPFSPAVANGVVYLGAYVGGYTAGALVAFPIECVSPCAPIFETRFPGGVETAPTIANGRLYLTTEAESVYVFELPS
jgi:outer membrane protein assembly factor BamB